MITEAPPAAAPQEPTIPKRNGAVPAPPGNPQRAGVRWARMKRRVIYAALGVVAIALVALALRPSPVDVELGAVTRGPLTVTLEAEGVTRVVERYSVSAPVTGRLERMTLREGDVVRAGSVVAWLTPVPIDPRSEAQARARLASAQSLRAEAASRVEQARAAYVQAAREAARRRELEAAGALSLEQREQAELAATLREREMQALQAAARAADAEVAAARGALLGGGAGETTAAATVAVRAPVGGRVLRIPERSERIVAAGSPLLEVGDAAGLELVLDLLSTDAVAVRPGTPLLIVNWGGPDTLDARVRRVEPAAFTKVSALGVEEQRVNVIGDLLAPPPGLGEGYRVDAAVVLSHTPDAIRVPASALFQQDGRWSAFVVEGGRAHLRPVAPGRRGGGLAEVLSGLKPGEQVVRYPSDALEDGARVRPST
jgi:HlyD family secretion protein